MIQKLIQASNFFSKISKSYMKGTPLHIYYIIYPIAWFRFMKEVYRWEMSKGTQTDRHDFPNQ